MATVERIEQLLNCAERVPVKDNAGIIIPAGIDAAVRVKAFQECLRLIKDEVTKEDNHDI